MSHRNQGSKWITKKIRLAIYNRDGNSCLYCGISENLSLDHFDPRASGKNNNSPRNLLTCCHRCNSSRRHKPLAQWLVEKFPGSWDRIFLKCLAQLQKKIT
jgi:5-methylcytosine-specific restriction endonuclease McrA